MRPFLIATLAAALVALGLPAAGASPAGPTADSRVGHHHRGAEVSTAVYDLGDQVFTDPEVTEGDDPPGDVVPMELTAVVHYPSDMSDGEHPLVVLEHGSWWTCVNTVKQRPTGAWPCKERKDQVPLPSYRGYDYLGKKLARHGIVAVSISANAINAHVLGDVGYLARAHLINKHLEMWQQLADDGDGPLAGAFVDPATGETVDPAFTGHVDMTDVGTLGHSRAGKGVMWQASDLHTPEWPDGVQVQAVVALAPVYFTPPGETNEDTVVTQVPFRVVVGSCDSTVGKQGLKYVRDSERAGGTDGSATVLRGANHTFFNTQWSPGHVGGDDDATPDCRGPLGQHQQRAEAAQEIVPYLVDQLLG